MGSFGWLIEKSAYTRLSVSRDAEQWLGRIRRGLIRITTVTRLEIGYSMRSGTQAREEFASPPLSFFPVEYLTPAIEDGALAVQLLLADRGHHRGPSIPDLLVAATAEKAGLTVLAVDEDFDLISAVTGQRVETLTWAST